MQNNKNLRSVLGLNQNELATLLSITRSQLSMYELGKRDLPVEAKLKLSELLENINEKKLKPILQNNITEEEQQKIINEFIFLNQREYKNLEKKIIRLDNKIQKMQNATLLYENLKLKNNFEKNKIEKIKPQIELIKLRKEQFIINLKMKILKENQIFLENLS